MSVVEQEVVLRGKGVHSGLDGAVHFQKRDDAEGIRFHLAGWPQPLSAKDFGSLKRTARRATVLEGGDGKTFHTPEHLLAACLFFANESVNVFCDSTEPPGLDGSALPFFKALIGLFPGVANSPQWREYDSDLKWEYEGAEGWIQTSPAQSFSVDYEWSRNSLNQRFIADDSSQLVREILPARTFISYQDWLAAKHSGLLLAGVGPDSGLLLAESPEEFETAKKTHPEFCGKTFPLLHPEALRMDAEPVRHKILDLLGDLALSGLALPRLRLEIRNGGHALNHLLLEKLFDEQRQRTGF